MNSIDRQIREAIRYAVPLYETEGGGALRGPDQFGPHAGQTDRAAIVSVGSEEHFIDLLVRINHSLGGERPQSEIDNEVRHEGQHTTAAKVLGATATNYGVRFFKVHGPSFPEGGKIVTEASTTHTFARPISPLAKAAILAYPLEPSNGDMADIRGLGFAGIEQVGEAILTVNRESGLGIPVPLSYGSQSSRHIESTGRMLQPPSHELIPFIFDTL